MRSQILMLLVFIQSLSGCKKNDRVAVPDENKPALLSSASVVESPENPANAYDSIGYWHNRIVAYVQTCKPVTDTPDVEASTQSVLRFCRETKRTEPPLSSFSTVEQTVRQSNENIGKLIADCPYEKPVKAFLDTLVQLIKRLSNSDSPYPVIKAAIVDFERRVMHNNLLTPEGREIVLKTASVARFSIYYWINTLQPPAPEAAFKIKNIIRWIATVTSDIGGAIVGGDVEYAADCSAYAYILLTYSLPL